MATKTVNQIKIKQQYTTKTVKNNSLIATNDFFDFVNP